VVFLSRRDPGGGAAEISGATASVSSAASPPTATEAKLFGKPELLPIAHRSATPTLWLIPGSMGTFRHDLDRRDDLSVGTVFPDQQICGSPYARRSSPFTATPLHFA
jgi:hypothetical protein